MIMDRVSGSGQLFPFGWPRPSVIAYASISGTDRSPRLTESPEPRSIGAMNGMAPQTGSNVGDGCVPTRQSAARAPA